MLNVGLWTCQILLGLVFLGSGLVKGTQSKAWLVSSGQTGVQAYSLPFIRFIASMEVFGAAGLVLPSALGIARILTPLAAGGLAIIMLGAARAHAKLREPRNVAANLFLFALCVIVSVGRA